MGTALLVGIPAGYISYAKKALAEGAAQISPWTIKYIPAPRKEIQMIDRTAKQAREMASQFSDAHVLGFSAQKDRQPIADQIKPFFRFRWFDHSLLKHLGSPDQTPFVSGLARVLDEEAEWAARVKPEDLNSPLLLPECSFTVKGKHRDLWRHALAFGDVANIMGAEKAISDFRSAYRKRIPRAGFSAPHWVDEGERVFGDDGPRHGIPPFPREWKFSFRVEQGFHYDVTHIDGRRFTVNDATGRCHSVFAGSYVNIDAHGYVRS